MEINTLLEIRFVRALIQRVCGDDIELITRPSSFMIRNKVEGDRDIHRLIILPPKGYTADRINQTNSHDEAEYATIQIKGAVKEGKMGFSRLNNCLFVASISDNGTTSDLNKPYLTFDIESKDSNLIKTLHSSGTSPFAVVKNDGFGFYHNLINVTDDWLVLQLYKRLRPQKSIDLPSRLAGAPAKEAMFLQKLYEAIVEHGDGIFYEVPELIDSVCRISLNHSLPALAEMLYVHDTGKHEACSAFAIILKIGREYPEEVKNFLQQSMEEKTIPSYYAHQLVSKLDRAKDLSNYKSNEDSRTSEKQLA